MIHALLANKAGVIVVALHRQAPRVRRAEHSELRSVAGQTVPDCIAALAIIGTVGTDLRELSSQRKNPHTFQ